MGRKVFVRSDIMLAIALLAFSLVIYLLTANGRQEARLVRIITSGHPDIMLDLSMDAAFALPGRPAVHIGIKDGKAAFVASDCPDQICVKSGFLYRPGAQAACLPNKTAMVVVGTENASQRLVRHEK